MLEGSSTERTARKEGEEEKTRYLEMCVAQNAPGVWVSCIILEADQLLILFLRLFVEFSSSCRPNMLSKSETPDRQSFLEDFSANLHVLCDSAGSLKSQLKNQTSVHLAGHP